MGVAQGEQAGGFLGGFDEGDGSPRNSRAAATTVSTGCVISIPVLLGKALFCMALYRIACGRGPADAGWQA